MFTTDGPETLSSFIYVSSRVLRLTFLPCGTPTMLRSFAPEETLGDWDQTSPTPPSSNEAVVLANP